MNKEIESKILEVNFDEISKKITSIGGKLDFYKKKFTAVWVENELGFKYRIRKEGDEVIEEHKEILLGSIGVKEAIETPKRVIDFEEARAFAKVIGFREISFSVKERTQYLFDLSLEGYGKAKIVLDDYSDLDGLQIPTFLEIEADSREMIIKVAKLLGFKESDLKDWGAKKLIKYYLKQN